MNGVSIIICTYNGKNRIINSLFSILNLQTKFTFELLIIDNASTDNTTNHCISFLKSRLVSFSWKVIRENKKGLMYARMRGLYEAQYEILIYCDDDNLLSENYIETGLTLLESNTRIGALGGKGIPIFDDIKPDWFDQFSHSFAVGQQNIFDGKIDHYAAELYGACTFFLKDPLLKFYNNGYVNSLSGRKGKSMSSGEDVEWCYLIQLAGYELWYDSKLLFYHLMPKERMNWENYLKLKKGITSGVAKLYPYKTILKKRNIGFLNFIFSYFKQIIYSSLLFIYFFVKKLLFRKRYSLIDIQIGRVVLFGKVKAFYMDFYKSILIFFRLKKILRRFI